MSFGSGRLPPTSPRSRLRDARGSLRQFQRHPLEFEFAHQCRSPRLLPVVAGGIAAAVGVVGALGRDNVV